MHADFALLADSLSYLHETLTDKIVSHKAHAPKWKVSTLSLVGQDSPMFFVDDLALLYRLARTLRQLAEHTD